MDIQSEFLRALKVITFDKKAMKAVSHDKSANYYSVFFIGLSSFASVLAYWLFPIQVFDFVVYRPDLAWVFSRFILSFGVSLGSLYLVGFIAEELFSSKMNAQEYFRLAGYTSIVGLLMIIPFFGIFTALWSVALLWVIFKDLAQLEDWANVIMILIYAAIFAVLTGVSTGFGF